ncbi:MAG: C39 family peptidase, partial [Methanosarcinales archaeon]
MILYYVGIPKSYKELQRICPSWKRMDFQQLRDFIEAFGLKTIPLKNMSEAKNALKDGKPVVAFVYRDTYAKGNRHWIILRGFKGNVFAVSDPADNDIRRLEAKSIVY